MYFAIGDWELVLHISIVISKRKKTTIRVHEILMCKFLLCFGTVIVILTHVEMVTTFLPMGTVIDFHQLWTLGTS